MHKRTFRLAKIFARTCTVALLAALSAATAAAAPVPVVTTTSMVTDLVRQIGGNRVSVAGLMGPGVDPHLYKPSTRDITRLHSAKAVFYNGLMLEGRMGELFERLGKSGRKTYAVAGSLSKKDLLQPAEFEGHPDPHVWGDAKMWAACVDTVVRGLSEVDPQGAQEFAQRGAAYKAELVKLHEWALKRVQELPKESRYLVTSHDAFNYFGRAYGFNVVGVQGISTVSEAGLADITKVVDFIKSKKVKAIFVESSVPKATIERISQDSGAKVGGELYSDALGAPGTKVTAHGETYDEGTYIGMLKHNINTAVDALK